MLFSELYGQFDIVPICCDNGAIIFVVSVPVVANDFVGYPYVVFCIAKK